MGGGNLGENPQGRLGRVLELSIESKMKSGGSTAEKLMTRFIWVSPRVEVLPTISVSRNEISEGVKCDVFLIMEGLFKFAF